MKLLSFSLVLSEAMICGTLYWITITERAERIKQAESKTPVTEYIFKITDSGNLVRYNKKTLEMSLCGLSDQRYRCLHFENSQ